MRNRFRAWWPAIVLTLALSGSLLGCWLGGVANGPACQLSHAFTKDGVPVWNGVTVTAPVLGCV